ncbi:ABC-F family ATP-binding cassette domain-containing protein [Companilactobacillus sp.]|uniref:ABC-F family ATP-binding cassette domain-containing protein n=2 Tax=Companilactobacillus sp. TaxID=2767905 RepID=UPI0025BA05BA|nr:ABC-F family ATP-binding cassette domain-containing protein [Companilactobacillus sp.]MCH4010270.1 ABC-F family ATP-binding cassette domain-containing protein [Companilactobacillus sp.]MCH4052054.1 ABC-F family ATP-binding cassette domain-containing protein [Companilactobacillus sp.]MCH4078212.1 ABC-F family ATP-binding cassette domain-containing protein [Companilactobacillus sp.]MCH4126788.1 ABC-F family ATP-binding cassette domain-containing protein [Companilactobacillus sp.]MCH4132627.1 
MILLQAQNITKNFGTKKLFSNVSFEVQDNSRIGLVGRNGVGKSTLLKIISDQESYNSGNIALKKDTNIGYLAQDSGLNTENEIFSEMEAVFNYLKKDEKQMHSLEEKLADPSVDDYDQILKQYDQLQNKFRQENGYGYQSEIRSVLAGFGFDESVWHDKVSTLSGGERSRLAMAKMLLEHHEILLLDEPTNHLDIETVEWLEGYLKNYRGALVIVSHDQYFLDKVATEIVEINQHSATHYSGNYTFYLQEKKRNQAVEWKHYEEQQAEIKKTEEYIQKNIVRASTTKMAQSRRKKLEKMDVMDKPGSDQGSAHFSFEIDKESGNDVLLVKDVAIGYEKDQVMSSPINLDVKKGERVGIIGPNGIGKSTLLKSLLNKTPLLAGTYQFGANVQTGYYDQDLKDLDPKKDVLHEIWDRHPLLDEQVIRNILGSFLFSGDDVLKPVAGLSGGEKARLTLTKLSMEHDNFLMMDEPTNHLDIDSKEVLEDALTRFAGTVLFVSHDRYLLNTLADKIVEITPQGSKLYLGDYDYYLEKTTETKEEQVETESSHSNTSEKKVQYQQSKEQQRAERKLRRQVEDLENQISELDQRNTEIQAEMAKPENLSAYTKLADFQKELDENKARQSDLEDQWTEKSMELEEFGQ